MRTIPDQEWSLQTRWEAATDELHRLLDLHDRNPNFDPREIDVARADVRAARAALDAYLEEHRRKQS
jgi:hypothetical protein